MINISYDNRICTLIICNSDSLNTLGSDLCNDMISAIHNAYKKECVGIVIKAKCSSRGVWSAGHNINEISTQGDDPLSHSNPMEILLRTIQDIPIPVIAYVSGSVWGGACDLCLSCDMIVAVETATFAITPAKIGIPYNASGIMHFINQLGINKAREMFFTAQPITAREAENVGLLNHVAPSDELEKLTEDRILNPLRRNSILSISAIKRQFRLLSRAASSLSPENFEMINSWRERVYRSTDFKEGINSFLEKRQPNYKGKAQDLD